jgi:hypothetical protein
MPLIGVSGTSSIKSGLPNERSVQLYPVPPAIDFDWTSSTDSKGDLYDYVDLKWEPRPYSPLAYVFSGTFLLLGPATSIIVGIQEFDSKDPSTKFVVYPEKEFDASNVPNFQGSWTALNMYDSIQFGLIVGFPPKAPDAVATGTLQFGVALYVPPPYARRHSPTPPPARPRSDAFGAASALATRTSAWDPWKGEWRDR